MSKQIESPVENPGWIGYSLEELRYQRALASARSVIQQERLLNDVHIVRNMLSFNNSRAAKGIFGKVFNSLSYLDYGILAFRAFKHIRTLIHRKK